jgi:DNA-binding LytR/AlgR family response regulator
MIRVNICERDEIWRKQISEIVSDCVNTAQIAFKIVNYTSIEECINQIEEVHQSRLIICDCNKEEPEHIIAAFDFRSKHEEIFLIMLKSKQPCGTKNQLTNVRFITKSRETIREDLQKVIRELLALRYKSGVAITRKFLSGEEEISIDDIIYINSMNRILEFHVLYKVKPLKIYGKLNDMQKTLNDKCPDTFIRIHQRDLINAMYVEDIQGKQVSMCGGIQLEISKSRKAIDIKKAVDCFRTRIFNWHRNEFPFSK